MNILFLYKRDKIITNIELYHNIIQLMTICKYDISNDISRQDYDLIFVLGREKLNEACKIQNKLNIPIIYTFCRSELGVNYTIKTEKLDYVFIYEDRVSKTLFPIHKRLATFSMPFNLHIQEKKSKKDNCNKIYVHIDNRYFNDITTAKLVRILNQLTKYDILIYSSSKVLKQVLNSNIKLTTNINFKQDVLSADIIIGSGYVLLDGIINNKYSIVVGERGYGGIITEDTIENHYRNFFQGRNGGKYDEPIPEKLLIEDIEFIASGKVDLNNGIQDFLHKQEVENTRFFIQLIEDIIKKNKKYQEEKFNTPLIFNSDFTVMQSGVRYWVMNRYIKKVFGWVDEKQYSLIDKFIGENTISNVIGNMSKSEQIKSQKFIEELIKEKILTVFID